MKIKATLGISPFELFADRTGVSAPRILACFALGLLISALVGCASTAAQRTHPTPPTIVYDTALPGDADGDERLSAVEYRNLAFAAFHRGDVDGSASLCVSEVQPHERSLHQFADSNQDGNVDIHELLEFKSREFAQADLNQDGFIDASEWGIEASVVLLIVVDADHDGVVSRSEFLIAIDRRFDMLDRNHDGRLDPSEDAHGRAAICDADGDGVIVVAEWETYALYVFDQTPQPIRLKPAAQGATAGQR